MFNQTQKVSFIDFFLLDDFCWTLFIKIYLHFQSRVQTCTKHSSLKKNFEINQLKYFILFGQLKFRLKSYNNTLSN